MSFQELSDRLNAEKQMEIVKRKEKTESHLYMIVRILYEDNFYGHQGNDLYESDKVTYQEVRVKKQVSLMVVGSNPAWDIIVFFFSFSLFTSFHMSAVCLQDTLKDVINLLSEQSGQSSDRMRLWPLNHRTNQTMRPTLVDHDADSTKPVSPNWAVDSTLDTLCP